MSKSKFFRGANSRKGMTLVEIMVVIAILGTLMAVVTVNVVGRLNDANVETTRLQIKQTEQALQLYYAKKKSFPTTSEGLSAAAKYFPDGSVPKDAWDHEFLYFSPASDGRPYDIVSLGADGVEGGEEHNADIHSGQKDDE